MKRRKKKKKKGVAYLVLIKGFVSAVRDDVIGNGS